VRERRKQDLTRACTCSWRAFRLLTKSGIEPKAIADAQKIVSIWNAREAWRDLLASWVGSFHVFSTLPLSFDLIALGVEVVE
jgi:hypothetical protein